MQSLSKQRLPLLSAVTTATGTGTSISVDVQGRDEIVFYLTSTGSTSGGTILLEEADYDPNVGVVYSGTWSQIASVAASSFTGGAQTAYHISPNAYQFVRARVSANITGGGSVSVTLVMQ